MRNDSLDYGNLIRDAYRARNQVVGDMIAAAFRRAASRLGLMKKTNVARPAVDPAQRFCW